MRLGGLLLILLAVEALGSCSDEKSQADYVVCESTYALCTTAQCRPIEEGQGSVFCNCDVKTGYSVGTTPCHDPVDSPEGKQIVSRYYPVKTYAACDNDRPWAWCFDSPCVIDKDDPTKASCSCGIVKDKGPYVMITDTYTDTTCTTGLYSSATVRDLLGVTEFLKTNKDLKSYHLSVVKE